MATRFIQRRTYRLEEVEFELDHFNANENMDDRQWNLMFERFVDYKAKHGEMFQRLEDSKAKHGDENLKDRNWNSMFQHLVDYEAEHGDTNVKQRHEEFGLGNPDLLFSFVPSRYGRKFYCNGFYLVDLNDRIETHFPGFVATQLSVSSRGNRYFYWINVATTSQGGIGSTRLRACFASAKQYENTK